MHPLVIALGIFGGPFSSSRLFSMPTADVIGAYIVSLSGDGSLLQAPGRLTSSAVVAIGFGDLAQLEYRETGAISVTGVSLEWVAGWGVRYQALRWGAIELDVRHREGEGLGGSTVMVRVTGVLAP